MSVNSHPNQRATVRKRPVQARSQRTVDAVLDAAAHIFTTDGYAATTTNHVAERAGVSIGSLYQYFPNKDALLIALEERHLEHAVAELRAVMRTWRGDQPDIEAWAGSLVDALVAANDSALHVLLYETTPALPHLQDLVADLVVEVAVEVSAHLRRWGVRRDIALRAQVVVVTALRLVHDLVISLPRGPRRSRTKREVIVMVAAYVTAALARRGRPVTDAMMDGMPDLPSPVDDDATAAVSEPEGGEAACWTHLTCEECGAVSGEPHRGGCTARDHGPDDG